MSILTFWPATSLIAKGRKRELKRKDVWRLQTEFSAEYVSHVFERQWNKEVKSDKFVLTLKKTTIIVIYY